MLTSMVVSFTGSPFYQLSEDCMRRIFLIEQFTKSDKNGKKLSYYNGIDWVPLKTVDNYIDFNNLLDKLN